MMKAADTHDATDLERFLRYMLAFEMAFVSDDWSGLAAHFTADAEHRVHGAEVFGAGARGADAVVAGLCESVRRVDRRFDARIPEVLDGPKTRPDGIWFHYRLTLRRDGLPELAVEGEHVTRFRDGRIAAIDDRVRPGDGERVASYLREHDAHLRPAGAPFAPPTSRLDFEHALAAGQRTLVRCYSNAKSEQDIGAALVVCSDDFELEAPALPIVTRGREKAVRQLQHFFRAFPDFSAAGDGIALGPSAITSWGRARMTMGGEWLGHAPTGKTADYPFVCVFGFDGARLSGERFFFDAVTVCEQLGLSPDAFAMTVRSLASARA